MRLPDADRAVVPIEKVTGYLLSSTHPVGRAKAEYFMNLGFAPVDPDELIRSLIAVAVNNEVIETESTPWGTKYAVEGLLPNPANIPAVVRTVWIISDDVLPPRLVTAYPA